MQQSFFHLLIHPLLLRDLFCQILPAKPCSWGPLEEAGTPQRCYQQESKDIQNSQEPGFLVFGEIEEHISPSDSQCYAGMFVCVIPGVPPTEETEKEAGRQG